MLLTLLFLSLHFVKTTSYSVLQSLYNAICIFIALFCNTFDRSQYHWNFNSAAHISYITIPNDFIHISLNAFLLFVSFSLQKDLDMGIEWFYACLSFSIYSSIYFASFHPWIRFQFSSFLSLDSSILLRSIFPSLDTLAQELLLLLNFHATKDEDGIKRRGHQEK